MQMELAEKTGTLNGLTVAITAKQNKVDYSITSDGTKLYICLFMFAALLCGIAFVFSSGSSGKLLAGERNGEAFEEPDDFVKEVAVEGDASGEDGDEESTLASSPTSRSDEETNEAVEEPARDSPPAVTDDQQGNEHDDLDFSVPRTDKKNHDFLDEEELKLQSLQSRSKKKVTCANLVTSKHGCRISQQLSTRSEMVCDREGEEKEEEVKENEEVQDEQEGEEIPPPLSQSLAAQRKPHGADSGTRKTGTMHKPLPKKVMSESEPQEEKEEVEKEKEEKAPEVEEQEETASTRKSQSVRKTTRRVARKETKELAKDALPDVDDRRRNRSGRRRTETGRGRKTTFEGNEEEQTVDEVTANNGRGDKKSYAGGNDGYDSKERSKVRSGDYKMNHAADSADRQTVREQRNARGDVVTANVEPLGRAKTRQKDKTKSSKPAAMKVRVFRTKGVKGRLAAEKIDTVQTFDQSAQDKNGEAEAEAEEQEHSERLKGQNKRTVMKAGGFPLENDVKKPLVKTFRVRTMPKASTETVPIRGRQYFSSKARNVTQSSPPLANNKCAPKQRTHESHRDNERSSRFHREQRTEMTKVNLRTFKMATGQAYDDGAAINVRYVRTKGKKLGNADRGQCLHKTCVKTGNLALASSALNVSSKVPVRTFRTTGQHKKGARAASRQRDVGRAQSTEVKTMVSNVLSNLSRRWEEDAAIASADDRCIQFELESAEKLLLEKRPKEALFRFNDILKKHRRSPRANYGRAVSLELLAELHASDAYLLDAIHTFEKILQLPDVPDVLYRLAAQRMVNYWRSLGWFENALVSQKNLIKKFPHDLGIWNEFAVMLMVVGRFDEAKQILKAVLSRNPNNGPALLYMGLILRTVDDNERQAAGYIRRGAAAMTNRNDASRLVVHVGDALQRLNQTDEAYEIYEAAAAYGIFPSKYQRSLYNIANLRSNAWWTSAKSTYEYNLKKFENQWKSIKAEALSLLHPNRYQPSAIMSTAGSCSEVMLFSGGTFLNFFFPATLCTGERVLCLKNERNCNFAPVTCSLIDHFPQARQCKYCQAKFLKFLPRTHVAPRHSLSNCVLQGHLALEMNPAASIRVGEEQRRWKLGRFVVFDSSYEHEFVAGNSGVHLLLAIEFWHPDLSAEQQNSLPYIL